jgi:GDP-L-fucose synthase
MNKSDRILITGGNGLIGSALRHRLKHDGYENVISPTRAEVDLTDPVAVKWMFSVYRIDYVFHFGARVGGIKDNAENPVSFLVDNLRIQDNVLMNAAEYKVKKLLFLASSCCYPDNSPQPLQEKMLFTGPIHLDTEPYAIAKLAGIRLCQYLWKERGCCFISALPCNVFGPGDNFNVRTAHVVPGMMARMFQAMIAEDPTFQVWGDGTQRRELIYSWDLIDALLLLMEKYNRPEPINAGSGKEITIRDLSTVIAATVGYRGQILFNPADHTGVHHKLMDNYKLNALGFKAKTELEDALYHTYRNFWNR